MKKVLSESLKKKPNFEANRYRIIQEYKTRIYEDGT